MRSIEILGRPATLKRRTDGGYDAAGFAVADTVGEPLPIVAVEQPVSDDDLKDVAEGIREEAEFAFWTRAAIEEDDIVTISQGDFRVLHVEPWRDHNKAILGRLNQ